MRNSRTKGTLGTSTDLAQVTLRTVRTAKRAHSQSVGACARAGVCTRMRRTTGACARSCEGPRWRAGTRACTRAFASSGMCTSMCESTWERARVCEGPRGRARAARDLRSLRALPARVPGVPRRHRRHFLLRRGQAHKRAGAAAVAGPVPSDALCCRFIITVGPRRLSPPGWAAFAPGAPPNRLLHLLICLQSRRTSGRRARLGCGGAGARA